MNDTDLQKIACPICNSKNHKRLLRNGQFKLPTHVSICKDCGLLYLNPRWTKEKYNDFYKNEYDLLFRRKKIAANNINPQNIQVILSRAISQGVNLSERSNILDIGAANGDTLRFLKDEKFPNANYYAIEPSIESGKVLKKHRIKVISRDVDTDWHKNYSNRFDFIIMRHVLEHLLDPVGVMNKVREVLHPNGILYIAVPDSYNPRPPLLTNYFMVAHVLYLNRDALQNIFKLSQLRALSIIEGDKNNIYEVSAFCKKEEMEIEDGFSRSSYHKIVNIIRPMVRKEKIQKLITHLKTH